MSLRTVAPLALFLAACGTAKEAPPAAAAAPPTLQVYTAKPEGFLVTATLIAGARDAVLIDGTFTQSDGKALADMIKATGKHLTTVYVTHAHPDHYFGLTQVKAAFPDAKIVGLPSTVEAAKATWAGKVAQWKPMFGAEVVDQPLLPEPLVGNTIDLEGNTLELVGPVTGDDVQNSYVWISSLRAVVAGDTVFDGVHPWTANTTPAERASWIGTLDAIAAKNPAVVVPGHQAADRKDPSSVAFTKQYLQDFDALRATAKTSDELQAAVKQKHAGLALDVILKIGADAAYAAK
jgi:glyoxylase-like metal-dependent hydrolase (beta-lactamase superfamily II)